MPTNMRRIARLSVASTIGLVLTALACGALLAAICPVGVADAAPAKIGRIVVTIRTPKGIPASVRVRTGKVTNVLAKAPAGTSRRFTVKLRPGRAGVTAPDVLFAGGLYRSRAATTEVTIRRGTSKLVTIAYRPVPLAKGLRATAISQTGVTLAWTAPKGAKVLLRRTVGDRAAASPSRGTAVKVRGAGASDEGLKAASKYTYSLFTKVKNRWEGPVAARVGTASPDPTVAAYVLSSGATLVKPGEADLPAISGGIVTVHLRDGRPTPVIGAGFALPVSATLPGGFIGTVTAVSPDGRTVTLAPGGLADAFDYYNIDAGLAGDSSDLQAQAQTRGASPRAAGAGGLLANCDWGGGAEGSVTIHPIIKPDGHFRASLQKKLFPPKLAATFDVEARLTLGVSADIEVGGNVSCSLPGLQKFVKQIAVEPVPIALVFEPKAEITVGGKLSTKNVGYTVTGGVWAKGQFGIGVDDSAQGGLIHDAGPTNSDTSWSATLGTNIGGELTVGPGAGTDGVGAVAGIGGKLNLLKAETGPVFGDADLRHSLCLKTEMGLESEANLNAKAWAGSLSASASFTVPALKGSVTYGGPWYLPSDCPNMPAPAGQSLDIIGDGIQQLSSSTSGDAAQWGHTDSFTPGQAAWVLSTGRAADVTVADPAFVANTEMDQPGIAQLSDLIEGQPTYDGASFTTTVKPTGHTLHVRYVFASEEYPEYVDAGWDDVMAIFINDTNCALVPGTGQRVSVDSINDHTNSQYYIDNSVGASGYSTSMDGVTKPLTCDVPVTPGQPVTVKVAVADTNDHRVDSAVGLLDKGIWSD